MNDNELAVLRFINNSPKDEAEICAAVGLRAMDGHGILTRMVNQGLLKTFNTVASPDPFYMVTPLGSRVLQEQQ